MLLINIPQKGAASRGVNGWHGFHEATEVIFKKTSPFR
jgi:hypothetical protein